MSAGDASIGLGVLLMALGFLYGVAGLVLGGLFPALLAVDGSIRVAIFWGFGFLFIVVGLRVNLDIEWE